jgi:2-octaprenylphenol hydroxylase
MWDNYSSIVWSVPEDMYEHLMSLTEEDFATELNKALCSESDNETSLLGNYLGPNMKSIPPQVEEICNARLSFPLSTLSAESYCLDNVALIGDAAHTIHPMAGQGLNLGLLDSSILANVVCKALNEGREFSDQDTLFEYEWKAKANNYSM